MTERIAVVTGAARGIGLATSQLLSHNGWRVAMVDRDTAELTKAVTELKNAQAIESDVSSPTQVRAMVSQIVEEFGGIDALINNAGVADFGPIGKTSYDQWRTVMATNLDGVFLCTQECLPHLIEKQGSVVNIASISGLRASTLRVAYGTSKAAVMHLTKQQAAELGEHGVRVNCIAPGPVRTKLAMAVHSPEIIAAYHDAIPLNRYGSENEIAEAIVFLCSDKASYITGQVLSVDGGFESTAIGLPAMRKIDS
ncbi:MAG: SDR family oxidoreductase [Gammaproteobacteria bacterium]|nr:SDR family oxidoreductase [Gammaproteobacteria bacterium]